LLTKQVEDLTSEVAGLDRAKEENEFLRSALGFQTTDSRKLVPAEIISRDFQNPDQKVVLNRGQKHGAAVGAPVIVSGNILGVFPEGEDRKLLEVLEQMCNVLHKAAFDEILGDMVPYHSGDVQDFKKALSKAIAFDKLFSDSKGDDLERLCRLLKDVDSGRV